MKIHLFHQFKATFTMLGLVNLFAGMTYAQDTVFLKQLEQSHYLKKVMKVDPTDAGLTRWATKRVERSSSLPLAGDFKALKNVGPGTLQIDHHITRSNTGSILLKTPAALSVKKPTNPWGWVILPAEGWLCLSWPKPCSIKIKNYTCVCWKRPGGV